MHLTSPSFMCYALNVVQGVADPHLFAVVREMDAQIALRPLSSLARCASCAVSTRLRDLTGCKAM